MTVFKRSKRFLANDDGAVTVDWVVLTASVVSLVLVAMAGLKGQMTSIGQKTNPGFLPNRSTPRSERPAHRSDRIGRAATRRPICCLGRDFRGKCFRSRRNSTYRACFDHHFAVFG